VVTDDLYGIIFAQSLSSSRLLSLIGNIKIYKIVNSLFVLYGRQT